MIMDPSNTVVAVGLGRGDRSSSSVVNLAFDPFGTITDRPTPPATPADATETVDRVRSRRTS
jgi:hypothetical protein